VDVATHMGFIPENPYDANFVPMCIAIRTVAEHLEKNGQFLLFETGQETPVTLRRTIEDVGTGNLGINLDPANLVMVTGDDPVQAVHNLAPYIVHTHAKDGVKLKPSDPEVVYGLTNHADGSADDGPVFAEVPLGQGGVPFVPYLDALEKIGYKGFLTIEREVGENPVDDIALAVNFLKERI